MRWVGLLFWLGLCFTVAGVSASWTAAEVPGWYRTLARPDFAPPDAVFGPVWTVLYAMMAVAAWLVWRSPASARRRWGLGLFLVQLALNFAWSLIFFRMHAIGAALAEIVLLWGAIVATTAAFWRVSKAAGALMAPYLLWVSFALVLNGAFWKLN